MKQESNISVEVVTEDGDQDSATIRLCQTSGRNPRETRQQRRSLPPSKQLRQVFCVALTHLESLSTLIEVSMSSCCSRWFKDERNQFKSSERRQVFTEFVKYIHLLVCRAFQHPKVMQCILLRSTIHQDFLVCGQFKIINFLRQNLDMVNYCKQL